VYVLVRIYVCFGVCALAYVYGYGHVSACVSERISE